MDPNEDRREQSRLPIDSPAVLFWEDDCGEFEVKGQALNLSASGIAIRLRTPVKPGTILWCGVPSYGIYTRARVCHAKGLFKVTAGVQFLAGGVYLD